MSAPLLPSPLDYVGKRRFAFYPPILHPDPNEWLLGVGARSEVQAVNVHTGREIWVSRQYIGAVSDTISPLLVVGLTQNLKLSKGAIVPSTREVIEMPSADQKSSGVPRRFKLQSARPASVVAIRLAPKSESALTKAILTTCTGAVVVALLAALITAAIRF